jgi:hypothetical protein
VLLLVLGEVEPQALQARLGAAVLRRDLHDLV